MKDIIEPIDKRLIERELTPEKFLRKTNNGGNELYIINYHNSPYTMQEIGRLRELTFRNAGGGTGKAIDIDTFDTQDEPYEQLISWDPEDKEIVGGYRFHVCNQNSDPNNLATSKLFEFSEEFSKNYLPYMIELGRSFIQPKFQSASAGRKALFALDNLWDGLGALVIENPQIKYYFGKVTMYPHFHAEARNMILYFLNSQFHDNNNFVIPRKPLTLNIDESKMKSLFIGNDYKENYRILQKKVREFNLNIPPLINAYMNLSPSMKFFGTAINETFGEVEESGIMITIDDIFPVKKERHITTYIRNKLFRRFKFKK
ncbi:MAG: hemolysin [Bacteroidetes bacterium GWF2_33_16]|nr:MAG: hemolysin [Bacteroidetes bacterium GWE2_32_14]OFY03835.1 MAG: hemolysin [Bacteroidetes bacterium GWF2_33_16]